MRNWFSEFARKEKCEPIPNQERSREETGGGEVGAQFPPDVGGVLIAEKRDK